MGGTNLPAIAPSLVSAGFNGNQFRFTLTGTTGSNYVVQATTNLILPNWLPLLTNAGPFIFVDSNAATFGRRFFRAVVGP
jgi:hypothetical protein